VRLHESVQGQLNAMPSGWRRLHFADFEAPARAPCSWEWSIKPAGALGLIFLGQVDWSRLSLRVTPVSCFCPRWTGWNLAPRPTRARPLARTRQRPDRHPRQSSVPQGASVIHIGGGVQVALPIPSLPREGTTNSLTSGVLWRNAVDVRSEKCSSLAVRRPPRLTCCWPPRSLESPSPVVLVDQAREDAPPRLESPEARRPAGLPDWQQPLQPGDQSAAAEPLICFASTNSEPCLRCQHRRGHGQACQPVCSSIDTNPGTRIRGAAEPLL